MKPKLIFGLALVFFMGFALQRGFCSEEDILEPVEVSVRADGGAPFGEVSATIRIKGRDLERRISGIKLRVGGKSVRIDITGDISKRKVEFGQKHVLLEGTFNAKEAGHLGLWSGSIQQIKRFQI